MLDKILDHPIGRPISYFCIFVFDIAAIYVAFRLCVWAVEMCVTGGHP